MVVVALMVVYANMLQYPLFYTAPPLSSSSVLSPLYLFLSLICLAVVKGKGRCKYSSKEIVPSGLDKQTWFI